VLAVVRAAETVQYGAALARSQAELPVVAANAARMGQLSREGIIAPARADEAHAALARGKRPLPKTAACWRWAVPDVMEPLRCARRFPGAWPA
jgi:hypothetical protein